MDILAKHRLSFKFMQCLADIFSKGLIVSAGKKITISLFFTILLCVAPEIIFLVSMQTFDTNSILHNLSSTAKIALLVALASVLFISIYVLCTVLEKHFLGKNCQSPSNINLQNTQSQNLQDKDLQSTTQTTSAQIDANDTNAPCTNDDACTSDTQDAEEIAEAYAILKSSVPQTKTSALSTLYLDQKALKSQNKKSDELAIIEEEDDIEQIHLLSLETDEKSKENKMLASTSAVENALIDRDFAEELDEEDFGVLEIVQDEQCESIFSIKINPFVTNKYVIPSSKVEEVAKKSFAKTNAKDATTSSIEKNATKQENIPNTIVLSDGIYHISDTVPHQEPEEINYDFKRLVDSVIGG